MMGGKLGNDSMGQFKLGASAAPGAGFVLRFNKSSPDTDAFDLPTPSKGVS